MSKENDILQRLHKVIDEKFHRTDRTKRVDPFALKRTLTMWTLAKEFGDVEPSEMVGIFHELVTRDSVETNIFDDSVNPLDAYFIPKTELMSEEDFKIYMRVKCELN